MRQFIEEQGVSLFITLITGGLIVIISIISLFWSDVYQLIRDTHAFEAIVIVLLIEIVILLTQKDRSSDTVIVLGEENDAQAKIFEILKLREIERATIISAGLGSRRFLIDALRKAGVRLLVIAQDPETAIDKHDAELMPDIIELIKADNNDKNPSMLSLFFNRNPSTLRAVILYESKSHICHAFLGWYTYHSPDFKIHGSHNPIIYLTSRSMQGRKIIDWIEYWLKQNESEIRKVF